MKFDRSQNQHEHNVTAELYRQLKNKGADVYMSHRVVGAEFDLVLVKDERIALIFEIKKNKKSYMNSGAQVSRYFQYGVPIVLVVSSDMVSDAVKIGEMVLRGDKVDDLTRLVPTA